jgi:predicted phosphodiesterase
MKIQIFSDLHLEFRSFEPPDVGADLVILAGDIHVGAQGVDWALQTFGDTPVIYVLGNHEYYHHTLPGLCAELKARTRGTSVFVLENDIIEIDGITFLGCTLWTDFRLNGNAALAGLHAQQILADYRAIRIGDEDRLLHPADTVKLHQESRDWLETELTKSRLPLVVVTHHAPATGSVAEQYKNETTLNPAFVSNLDTLVASSKARYWVHGHTHTAFDYKLGNTRVICNPRGYDGEPETGFNPALTVTL